MHFQWRKGEGWQKCKGKEPSGGAIGWLLSNTIQTSWVPCSNSELIESAPENRMDNGMEGSGKIEQSPWFRFTKIHWWQNIFADFKSSFNWLKYAICRQIKIGYVWTIYVWIQSACHYFLNNLGPDNKIEHWQASLNVILIASGLINIEEMGQTWRGHGKKPSESNKFTIKAIGLTRISIHSSVN